VHFDDGSVGWYEAGWGPMMSETAFFIKDVMSPKGSVSIVLEGGPNQMITKFTPEHPPSVSTTASLTNAAVSRSPAAC